jgi:NAD+ kinase
LKTVLAVKPKDKKAEENAVKIQEILKNLSVELLPADKMAAADWITVVGGDGTIMHTAKQAAEYHKPILGINSGRVGFLAGLEPEEAPMISRILQGDYVVDNRMLLAVTYEKDGQSITKFSLNEVAITRSGPARMIDLYLTDGLQGGQLHYRADGLLVATPTGSTAYSLSAGGPVLDPFVEGMIVTPVCPFSLPSRSLVFSTSHTLKIEATCPADGQIVMCIDGEEPVDVTGQEITVKKAEDRFVQLIRLKNDAFFDIYKNKIMDRSV